MVLLAFEAINSCELDIRLRRVDQGNQSTMEYTALAWERIEGDMGPKLLASVKWIAGLDDRRTMDALILQLMYKLDAELAAGEFKRTLNP